MWSDMPDIRITAVAIEWDAVTEMTDRAEPTGLCTVYHATHERLIYLDCI